MNYANQTKILSCYQSFEGAPVLAAAMGRPDRADVLLDGPLADPDAELEQLAGS